MGVDGSTCKSALRYFANDPAVEITAKHRFQIALIPYARLPYGTPQKGGIAARETFDRVPREAADRHGRWQFNGAACGRGVVRMQGRTSPEEPFGKDRECFLRINSYLMHARTKINFTAVFLGVTAQKDYLRGNRKCKCTTALRKTP
jgi:hypothetical protein